MFVWGVDLFNFGYYWEAHEAWEAVWQREAAGTVAKSFLKGLIKLAASGVKAREGQPNGVKRHAARAQELFRELEHDELYGGLEVAKIDTLCMMIVARPQTYINTERVSVMRVFPVWLVPGGVSD